MRWFVWPAMLYSGIVPALEFLLIGTVVLIPMILGCTAYAYWLFRVKIDRQEGYH
jgi:cytochrome d ubiquinol oxidase subunit II